MAPHEKHISTMESYEEPYTSPEAAAIPRGWKYRPLFGRLPHYASPQVQLTVVAFVCFLCPGKHSGLETAYSP